MKNSLRYKYLCLLLRKNFFFQVIKTNRGGYLYQINQPILNLLLKRLHLQIKFASKQFAIVTTSERKPNFFIPWIQLQTSLLAEWFHSICFLKNCRIIYFTVGILSLNVFIFALFSILIALFTSDKCIRTCI